MANRKQDAIPDWVRVVKYSEYMHPDDPAWKAPAVVMARYLARLDENFGPDAAVAFANNADFEDDINWKAMKHE